MTRRHATESDIVTQAMRDIPLALGGRCKVLRLNAGSAKNGVRGVPAGTPDILVILQGGRCVWLEFKRDADQDPSDAQIKWHKEARVLGHEVHTVWSVQDAVVLCRSAGLRAAVRAVAT